MHECKGSRVLVRRTSNKQGDQNASPTFCPKGDTFPTTFVPGVMVNRHLGKTLKAGPGQGWGDSFKSSPN